MYSGQCVALLLFIFTQADGLERWYLGVDAYCTHEFQHKFNQICYIYGDVNNGQKGKSKALWYCDAEDVPDFPDDFHYSVWQDKIGNITDSLKIQFTPPKKECGLGIALLVNPLIKNKRECDEYKFDINSNVHTKERAICIFRDTDRLVKYNDNSTSLCESNIELWFRYIFTGCYAVQFRIGGQKYVTRGPIFLNTTYQRMEVKEPSLICKYETYYNPDQRHEITNFTLDASLPMSAGASLEVGLISPRNKISAEGCVFSGEPLLFLWPISLEPGFNKVDDRCNLKVTRTVNGEYVKTLQCNFKAQNIRTADYCFLYSIIDYRCYKDTIWKPLSSSKFPCTWVKECMNVSERNKNNEMLISDKLQSTNLSLLLPIIATVLIVLTAIGILCFWHLCIRKKEIILYVNPQHDDFLNSACFESTDLNIVDNNEKEIDHDNLSCNDIVLLYTKNSTSFIALMKDFRETLAKMCSCSVYDWYDEAEWNNVAKVGPVSWFTKLLNGKCRVVWIDTPTTRSIVISRENDSGLNKLCKYHEIGDFRDVAFPVVLELAKRNTNDVMHQYRRHFVVRFEGLESTANVNDPFLDLSPHARYYMPQHLAQLCLDLSTVKSLISKYQLKVEENLLQQRLRLVKIESII